MPHDPGAHKDQLRAVLTPWRSWLMAAPIGGSDVAEGGVVPAGPVSDLTGDIVDDPGVAASRGGDCSCSSRSAAEGGNRSRSGGVDAPRSALRSRLGNVITWLYGLVITWLYGLPQSARRGC